MFDWSSNYSVGLSSIDAQHQKLFALARELHTAMSVGEGKAAAGRILDRLIQYTTVHFAHEERLMRLYDYRDAPAHRREHELLTQQVVKFQEEFHLGRAVITVQLLQFIKEWLVKHIQCSDLKLAPYLKDKAVA